MAIASDLICVEKLPAPSVRGVLVISLLLVLAVCVACPAPSTAAPKSGELRIRVVDADTNEPLPCRIHLKSDRGVPRKVAGLPFWKDHFVFDGTLDLALREGNYTFEIERGPEYYTRVGHFSMDRFGHDEKVVPMKRIVDMTAEGWWSGDMYVHRRIRDIELLMKADDLHVAHIASLSGTKNDWSREPLPESLLVQFDEHYFYHVLAGRDARGGGGLALMQLPQPLPMLVDGKLLAAEYPSSLTVAQQARQMDGVWIEAETSASWDLPVWIAHGVVDSVRLASHRFGRDAYLDRLDGNRPRDRGIYDGAQGLGAWSEYVYYQLLNCGLRLPPTAGSGSGDVANPVGYNRVYVYCGKNFSYEKWWEGLKEGRTMVTNGPLLRPTVESRPPGFVFQGEPGKTLRLEIQLQMATKDKIEYLEVIKNGEVEHVVRLDDYVDRAGRLPPVEFDSSGWFLVRGVTGATETYRFASSAPWYVQIGDQPRISRRSVKFFLDWIFERARQIARLPNESHRQEILRDHRKARDYWQELFDQANAD